MLMSKTQWNRIMEINPLLVIYLPDVPFSLLSVDFAVSAVCPDEKDGTVSERCAVLGFRCVTCATW